MIGTCILDFGVGFFTLLKVEGEKFLVEKIIAD